jgi:hypothetical protein
VTTTLDPSQASPARLPDPEIAAVAAGDRGAWYAIVDRHAQQVWDTAMDLGLDAATAAIVCRLAWWRLLDHLGELRTDTEVLAWLSSVVDRDARATGVCTVSPSAKVIAGMQGP